MLGLLVRECVLAYDMQPFDAIGRLFKELVEYAASNQYGTLPFVDKWSQ